MNYKFFKILHKKMEKYDKKASNPFINNDEDKKVSNEVESIILQNLINGSDRIKMPNKVDYKFITGEKT